MFSILAVTLALGGDRLADVALLRAEPGGYGPVASDPKVSRTIDALAADAPRPVVAINTARAQARANMWALAGAHAPDVGIDADRPLVIDLDAALVTSHSDKDSAHPMLTMGHGAGYRCTVAAPPMSGHHLARVNITGAGHRHRPASLSRIELWPTACLRPQR